MKTYINSKEVSFPAAIRAHIISKCRNILFSERISEDTLIKQWALIRRYGDRVRTFRYLNLIDTEQIYLHENARIREDAWIWCHEQTGTGEKASLQIGVNTYIGPRFKADCYCDVLIGDNCLFAEDVMILTADHGTNAEGAQYIDQPAEIGRVVIEDECWIGARVAVMPGVKIGKRSIVGTNAVVTGNIPPYCIAVGAPARVIKHWNFDLHCWESE